MKKLLLAIGSLASATLIAQTPAPAGQPAPASFEVASIKRNTSGDGPVMMGFQPGRLTFTNFPIRQLIVRAYEVQPFQIVGGPAWLQNDRFDISAKAEGVPTGAEMNQMLQSLLAERFHLKVHKEMRQGDVFRLVKARADGKLGEAMQPSAASCVDPMRGRGVGPAPGAGNSTAPVPAPAQAAGGGSAADGRIAGPGGGARGGRGDYQIMIGPGRMELRGQSLAGFANFLSGQIGRPVTDDTGIPGCFDMTLSYMPEGRGGPIGPPPPGAPDFPAPDPNAPLLSTALQEQLGLKLEPAKGPVEMIVIDSIEPPTEN